MSDLSKTTEWSDYFIAAGKWLLTNPIPRIFIMLLELWGLFYIGSLLPGVWLYNWYGPPTLLSMLFVLFTSGWMLFKRYDTNVTPKASEDFYPFTR